MFFQCLTSTSINFTHAKEISTKFGEFLELKHAMAWIFMPSRQQIYVEILIADVMILGGWAFGR